MLWVPHQSSVFALSRILEDARDNEDTVSVEIQSDMTICDVKKSVTHPVDPTHLIDLDDLCDMNSLHEAPLLDVLRRRLAKDIIYTYIGNILVSLNPYKTIDLLYDSPLQFLQSGIVGSLKLHSRIPHVFAIADEAFQTLLLQDNPTLSIQFSDDTTSVGKKINQSIIITGESGAGKTEASKHVISFLTLANANDERESVASSLANYIKDVIVDSNAIFESFGNAKTVRNDNSSRFGKYVKLEYTARNRLASAYTETFLLEKSRLVSVGENERNYHVFYQMIRGLARSDPAFVSQNRLSTVDDFMLLTEGGCTVVHSEDNDIEEFTALCQSMKTIGFTEEEQHHLWELLACLLHLGNVTCRCTREDGPVDLALSTWTIEDIARTFGLPANAFVDCVTTQTVAAGAPGARRASVRTKLLSAEESRNNILAMIKWLYKNFFSWIVRKINHAHGKLADDNSDKVVKFIGILDIFGFEILLRNSFEQLCINFTNERLQQQFNEHVFVLEQQEYAREGLDWASISYRDNQHVIDLVSKKPTGLFYVLEEHGMLNRKPDDLKLVQAFNQTHDRVSEAYSKSRFGNDGFTVKHFAGSVTYLIDGFLVKNNDSLQGDLLTLLQSTENLFLANVIAAESPNLGNAGTPGGSGGSGGSDSPGYIPPRRSREVSEAAAPVALGSGGKKMASSVTVSFNFRNQLDQLMSTLRFTQPYYIKCVKPNSLKQPCAFDAKLTMEQLKYSGVLEVVRIRQEGFPHRVAFQQFYTQYEILSSGKGWVSPEECSAEQAKEYSIVLTSESLLTEAYQIGHNFVFLRRDGLDAMQGAIKAFLGVRATRIQASYRRRLGVRYFATAKKRIVLLQALGRRLVASAHLKRVLKMVAVIRKYAARWRMIPLLRQIRKIQLLMRRTIAAERIQALSRGHRARKRYRERRRKFLKAQLVVAALHRQRVCRRVFLATKRKIVLLQALIRRRLAKQMRRNLFKHVSIFHRMVRGFLGRRKAARKYFAVLLLQVMARGFVARRRAARRYFALLRLQYVARGFLGRRKARGRSLAVLWLQALFRGLSARRKYRRSLAAVKAIQRLVRRLRSRKIRKAGRFALIWMQNSVRRFLAVKSYVKSRRACVKIQAWMRRVLARRSYLAQLRAALRAQCFVRMAIARRCYRADAARAVYVQALIRRYLSSQRYNRVLLACRRMQRKMRRCLAVMLYLRRHAAILRLQAFGRKGIAMREFRTSLDATIRIQKIVRRMLARKCFKSRLDAMRRLHVCVRRYLLNKKLRVRILALHSACERGDVATVGARLRTHPGDAAVRNKWNNLCTLLHSAALGSQQDMLNFLSLKPGQVMQVTDRYGSLLVHYACMRPELTFVKYLSDLMNGVVTEAQVKVMADSDDEGAHLNLKDLAAAAAVGASGTALPVLKAGWLKKRKRKRMLEMNPWQRRWCVLTEESLTLYHGNAAADMKTPAGVIPLEGCTIVRAAGRDYLMEISSPHTVRKAGMFGAKSSSINFMAESEKDLLEWVNPVKAAAGVKPFRDTPIRYVNAEFRESFLSMTNKRGETPLHCLADTGLDPKSPADSERMVTVAGWLIDTGCSIDARTKAGLTALQVAIAHQNISMIVFLVHRGADTSKMSQQESEAMGAALESRDHGHLDPAEFARLPAYRPRLPAPVKLRGYSYLSLYLQKLVCGGGSMDADNRTFENPHLCISVFNAKQELIEAVQTITGPAHVDAGYLWWAQMWNMQTPLENLGPGCSVVIALQHGPADNVTKTVQCWGSYSIEFDVIETGPTSVQCKTGPVDPSAAKAVKRRASILRAAPVHTGPQLDAEIVISKKFRHSDLQATLLAKSRAKSRRAQVKEGPSQSGSNGSC